MARGAREAESIDGRVQRSLRSQERILDALIELIREGELLPTGEQIAERAGVGLRSVFRHFEDMEGLYAQIQTRVERLVRPLIDDALAEGDLETRLRAMVRRRATVFEAITAFQRSEQLRRWSSSFLQDRHAQMVRELRGDLLRCLPELRRAPAPLQQAAELVTSFEAWDRLRSEQGLGRERAEDVTRETVSALLSSGTG